MQIAFSTVACPSWPLDRVFAVAEELGYDGVDLRTFGENSSRFAGDPFMTGTEKTRMMAADAGVVPAVISTGLSFDTGIFPPIVGRAIRDNDKQVRAARRAVRLGAELSAPLVRVFGFELQGGESFKSGLRRIAPRLRLVGAAARNTPAVVVVENGGSFATSEQLGELLDAVDHPKVRAAYSPAVAIDAGEDPIDGLNAIAGIVDLVKLKDVDDHGRPVLLGEGNARCQDVVRHLADRVYRGWISVEWDLAWFEGLREAEQVLPEAIRRVYAWRSDAGPGVPTDATTAAASV
ncbi:MAG: sugar phosphate isomerase/epimerase family protein [Planctomycetota bacterium]